MYQDTDGRSIVSISGPSGVGKSYLIQAMVANHEYVSVPQELMDHETILQNPQEYFMSDHSEGKYYGILRRNIECIWAVGKIPVVQVPLDGIDQFIIAYPHSYRVYLKPLVTDSGNVLMQRLRQRNPDVNVMLDHLLAADKELRRMRKRKEREKFKRIFELTGEENLERHIIEPINQALGRVSQAGRDPSKERSRLRPKPKEWDDLEEKPNLLQRLVDKANGLLFGDND